MSSAPASGAHRPESRSGPRGHTPEESAGAGRPRAGRGGTVTAAVLSGLLVIPALTAVAAAPAIAAGPAPAATSLGVGSATATSPAAALSPAAVDPSAACTDGVTVVVDFTDLGGQIEIGCAEAEPQSGRDALEQAGFTPTDSVPGMICAIDSQPDPCPEEFDGNFWSYWSGTDQEWTAHTEGADGTDPAPGDVEGWRYNDGTTAPGVSPVEAAAQAGGLAGEGAGHQQDPEEPAGEDETAEAAAETGTNEDAGESSGSAIWIGALIALAAVAALFVIGRLRRRQQ